MGTENYLPPWELNRRQPDLYVQLVKIIPDKLTTNPEGSYDTIIAQSPSSSRFFSFPSTTKYYMNLNANLISQYFI